jgi:CAAX prenyl protease-like protein
VTSPIPTSLAEIPAGLAAVWLLFRVLGSVITVPIAEELAFRGYLLRRLIAADFDEPSTLRFTWLSFVLSSLLFGALHGRWLAGTVAGMFYAWALYRRGRVDDAILAHALTNALIAAEVLILGQWELWG